MAASFIYSSTLASSLVASAVASAPVQSIPQSLPKYSWTEDGNCNEWLSPESNETIVLLMRHAETKGNNRLDPFDFTYTGCVSNNPLNEEGNAQAKCVAQAMASFFANLQEKAPVAAIYTSDRIRSLQTAEPVREALGVEEFQPPVEGLREIHWGSGEERLVAEIEKEQNVKAKQKALENLPRDEQWKQLPCIENAEKYGVVAARMFETLTQIAEENKGKKVLVVGHGRTIKLVTQAILDIQKEADVPYPDNAGTIILSYKDGVWKAVELRKNH